MQRNASSVLGKLPEFANIKNRKKLIFQLTKNLVEKCCLLRSDKNLSLVSSWLIIITPTLLKTEEVFSSSRNFGSADILVFQVLHHNIVCCHHLVLFVFPALVSSDSLPFQ